MMKIWLITEWYHPYFGGAPIRFKNYIPGFRNRGVEYEILTVNKGKAKEFEIIDETLIYRFSTCQNSTDLAKGSLEFLRNSKSKPDIIQVISHTIHGVPYIWQMKKMGIPCINIVTMNPSWRYKGIKRLKRCLHQRLRYSPFKYLVCSSQTVKNSLNKLTIPEDKIVVIPNGVDIDRFSPTNTQEKAALKCSLGFSKEDRIVLFVGATDPRKGTDILTQAWLFRERGKTEKLVIVGTLYPTTEFTQKIFQNLSGNPEYYNVFFLGKKDNVDEYMKIADVVVLPSRKEGMGNIVMEAMASSVPCVLTPYDGLPDEFGKPGREYLLSDFDPHILAQKIDTLIQDTVFAQSIGRNGYHWVKKHLDVNYALDSYVNLYKQCVKAK